MVSYRDSAQYFQQSFPGWTALFQSRKNWKRTTVLNGIQPPCLCPMYPIQWINNQKEEDEDGNREGDGEGYLICGTAMPLSVLCLLHSICYDELVIRLLDYADQHRKKFTRDGRRPYAHVLVISFTVSPYSLALAPSALPVPWFGSFTPDARDRAGTGEKE